MTQGEIGFILQNTIQSALNKHGIKRSVVTLITQVVVDHTDPAFQRPAKPIGPFYSRTVAEQKHLELGWNIIEDAARGYRRVVPSPLPKDIVELDVIRKCIEQDFIVITVGGGGIPVVERDGTYVGVEAVIDKDRASSLLATRLNVQQFIISTDVENVCLNYKKPDQLTLRAIASTELKEYLQQGHFQEGSMRPKIESALQFLDQGGQKVIITNPEHILAALDGKAGTIISHSNDGHETPPRHRVTAIHSSDTH
jgi:carbamate kinase